MNGTGHAAITIAVSVGVLYTLRYMHIPDDMAYATVGGCLTNLFVHPDMDQAESSSSPYMLPWLLYGKLIPHRSPLSHFPILGTFLRVAYLVLLFIASAKLFDIPYPQPNPTLSCCAFMGLCTTDLCHAIADFATGDKSK